MDINAYISSGILESYVLGELPPAEAREVAEMASRYPEVQEELQYIEKTLELVARSASVAPRADLRSSILTHVAPNATPGTPAPKAGATIVAEKEAPVRPLHTTPAMAPRRQSSWLMAASISLALISSLAAAYFWSRWQQTEEALASLAAQNTVLVQNVSTLENSAAGMEQTLAVLTDPTYQTVTMKGLTPAPDALAVVYWDPASAEVYVNPGSLPTPPSGKQYQLWAIVDGQPVDAGVFDTSAEQLQKMKEIKNATAFAVTLEPRGGSPSPTMEQMYVMGAAS